MDEDFTGKKPCSGCPFSRTVPPTSRVDVFRLVGQSIGPFFLPCHQDADYRGAGDCNVELHSCVGAAIFRANIGVTDLMPPAIAKAAPDTAAVFANFTELVAHQKRVSPPEADLLLAVLPPRELLAAESASAGLHVISRKREDGSWTLPQSNTKEAS